MAFSFPATDAERPVTDPLPTGTRFTFPDGTSKTAKRPVPLDDLLRQTFGTGGLAWTRDLPAPGFYVVRPMLSERAKPEAKAPRLVEIRDGWVVDKGSGGYARPEGYEVWPVRIEAPSANRARDEG